MWEYHVKFFETDNDFRLSSIYPSSALSDFHLSCRFESLCDIPLYAAREVPPDCKLCIPWFPQSRFTAFRTLIKFSRILPYKIGLFIHSSIYSFILCVSWIFCLYLSFFWKWTSLNVRIFLRKPGNI